MINFLVFLLFVLTFPVWAFLAIVLGALLIGMWVVFFTILATLTEVVLEWFHKRKK